MRNCDCEWRLNGSNLDCADLGVKNVILWPFFANLFAR